MALPAIPAIGGLLKGTGLVAAGSKARAALPRAGSWVNQNLGRLGFGAAGAGGGYAGASIFQRLGIEDSRLQTLSIIGLLLAAVYVVGQLFDIQIGG